MSRAKRKVTSSIDSRLRALEEQREGPGGVYFVQGNYCGMPDKEEVEALHLRERDTLLVISPGTPCSGGGLCVPCWECEHYAECLEDTPGENREERERRDRLEQMLNEGRAWLEEVWPRWSKPRAVPHPVAIREEEASASTEDQAGEQPARRGVWPQ